MLFSAEVASLMGAIGLLSLAVSWHRRKKGGIRLAQFGWVLVGLTFFNDASKYLSHDDLVNSKSSPMLQKRLEYFDVLDTKFV